MPNSILHKRSSTAGVVPHAALLANGELALNTADGTWFLKKTDGTVLDLRQPLLADGGEQPLSGINPDAQDWQTRVISAGGTVSAATFTAVNNFCNAITAAGIRDRFYRLNLFCGDNLVAALVPLYRGPTLSGTQFGNATDTNVSNNFVAGDYVETGITGGLKGNGSNKALRTGLLPSDMGGSLHLSVALMSDVSVNTAAIGADNFMDAGWTSASIDFATINSALRPRAAMSSNVGVNFAETVSATTAARLVSTSSRASGATQRAYFNGALSTTNSPTYLTQPAFDFAVFAINRKNTSNVSHTAARLSAYSIGVDLTDAQVAAFDSALRSFQTALSRVAAVVANADAQDWLTRVYAAGGTVSQSTANAVNNFCNSIDAAGIRDRFYRLNLFCGDDLTAALVPLYRGPTRTGTQYGNATDTNVNFLAADYVERGSGGGIKGNGTSKHLDTGLALTGTNGMGFFNVPNTFPYDTTTVRGHLSAYHGASLTGGNRYYIAANGNGQDRYWLGADRFSTTTISAFFGHVYGAMQTYLPGAETGGHRIMSRENATFVRQYLDGDVVGENSTSVLGAAAGTDATFTVFALNNNGVVARWHDNWIAGYSIGDRLTATQVSAYTTAMREFQTALNRAPPLVTNLDAKDWVARVYAAGGTVSQSTANAINTFCNNIDSTGLRDRFYRLNLFCGSNLAAATVPLYRSWRPLRNINLAAASEKFTGWSATLCTIAQTTATDPPATINSAFLLTETTATGQRHVEAPGLSTAISGQLTASVYFKANVKTAGFIQLTDGAVANNIYAYYNLTNLTSTHTNYAGSPSATNVSTSIIDVGNGWRRCILTASGLTGGSFGTFRVGSAVYAASDVARHSFASSGDAAIYLAAAQLENGATATTYNPPQYGSSLDTNFNFVSTDYVETGLTGGLTGNGNLGVQAGSASKHLRTGLQQATLATSLLHLSAYVFGLNTTAPTQQAFMGIRNNVAPAARWWFSYRQTGVLADVGDALGSTTMTTPTANALIVASRSSNSLLRYYVNGLQFGQDNTTDITANLVNRTNDWYVAAANIDSNPGEFCGFRLGMYSIGLSLTAQQAQIFNIIVQTLQTTLNRLV